MIGGGTGADDEGDIGGIVRELKSSDVGVDGRECSGEENGAGLGECGDDDGIDLFNEDEARDSAVSDKESGE